MAAVADATILLPEFRDRDEDVAVLCKQSPVLWLVFKRGFFSLTVLHALVNRISELDEKGDLQRRVPFRLVEYMHLEPVDEYARWAVNVGNHGQRAKTWTDVDWYAEEYHWRFQTELNMAEMDWQESEAIRQAARD